MTPRPRHPLRRATSRDGGALPMSRRAPCALCEAKRHAAMHFAPLRDSPIQQRPAEWFASACTSLPAAARARHERPTVLPPVTAYPLRPPRGARSCGDGSKLPLTAQDRARTVAFSPQDVYLVPWAQQMPVVVPSHNTKNGVAPSDQHWETAPRELGTEQSRARRNGAHWWRAKGEAGGPVTTYVCK